MQVKGEDSPPASDAALGPQREGAARVAWAGQGPGTPGGLLDRPTSCPPGARSSAARPCSPGVGGPRGNLPRTGSLAGHVGALTLHGKRPSRELVRLLLITSDAFLRQHAWEAALLEPVLLSAAVSCDMQSPISDGVCMQAADHVMDARRFKIPEGPSPPGHSALLSHPGSPSSVTDDLRPAKRHSRLQKCVSLGPLS